MTREEFLEIKEPTWIRVFPPDSPFSFVGYYKISKARAVIRGKTIFECEAFLHAFFSYTSENSGAKRWDFFFPKEFRIVSRWDIQHAAVAKSNWYRRVKKNIIFDSIFKGKR